MTIQEAMARNRREQGNHHNPRPPLCAYRPKALQQGLPHPECAKIRHWDGMEKFKKGVFWSFFDLSNLPITMTPKTEARDNQKWVQKGIYGLKLGYWGAVGPIGWHGQKMVFGPNEPMNGAIAFGTTGYGGCFWCLHHLRVQSKLEEIPMVTCIMVGYAAKVRPWERHKNAQ